MTDHGLTVPAKRRVSARAAVVTLAAALVLGVGGGVLVRALHHDGVADARPALPAFHGQALWAAGKRPAPNFTLRDQNGAAFTLAALRGKPVLLTFLDSHCRNECPIEGRQLGMVLRAIPAAKRPVLVVVSVDQPGDTPFWTLHALRKWRLAGPWQTYWVNGATPAQLAAVWRSYDITVEQNATVHSLALYLIDRAGNERTAYLFPFLPSFVERDLVRLASSRA